MVLWSRGRSAIAALILTTVLSCVNGRLTSSSINTNESSNNGRRQAAQTEEKDFDFEQFDNILDFLPLSAAVKLGPIAGVSNQLKEVQESLRANDFSGARDIYMLGTEPAEAQFLISKQNNVGPWGLLTTLEEGTIVAAPALNDGQGQGQVDPAFNLFYVTVAQTVTVEESQQPEWTLKVRYDTKPIDGGCTSDSKSNYLQSCFPESINGEHSLILIYPDSPSFNQELHYSYDIQADTTVASLQQIHFKSVDNMIQMSGQMPPEFKLYRDFFGQDNYGDLFISLALKEDISASMLDPKAITDNKLFQQHAQQSNYAYFPAHTIPETVEKLTLLMNTRMEIMERIHSISQSCRFFRSVRFGSAEAMQAAIDEATDKALQLLDEAVTLYAGSNAQTMIYGLSEQLAQTFDTTEMWDDVILTSVHNIHMMGMFSQMQGHVTQFQCESFIAMVPQLSKYMAVPNMQGLLKYAWLFTESPDAAIYDTNGPHPQKIETDKAEAVVFAQAILPHVADCAHDQLSAVTSMIGLLTPVNDVLVEVDTSRPIALYPTIEQLGINFDQISFAIESTAHCMGLTCMDLTNKPATSVERDGVERCDYSSLLETAAPSSSQTIRIPIDRPTYTPFYQTINIIQHIDLDISRLEFLFQLPERSFIFLPYAYMPQIFSAELVYQEGLSTTYAFARLESNLQQDVPLGTIVTVRKHDSDFVSSIETIVIRHEWAGSSVLELAYIDDNINSDNRYDKSKCDPTGIWTEHAFSLRASSRVPEGSICIEQGDSLVIELLEFAGVRKRTNTLAVSTVRNLNMYNFEAMSEDALRNWEGADASIGKPNPTYSERGIYKRLFDYYGSPTFANDMVASLGFQDSDMAHIKSTELEEPVALKLAPATITWLNVLPEMMLKLEQAVYFFCKDTDIYRGEAFLDGAYALFVGISERSDDSRLFQQFMDDTARQMYQVFSANGNSNSVHVESLLATKVIEAMNSIKSHAENGGGADRCPAMYEKIDMIMEYVNYALSQRALVLSLMDEEQWVSMDVDEQRDMQTQALTMSSVIVPIYDNCESDYPFVSEGIRVGEEFINLLSLDSVSTNHFALIKDIIERTLICTHPSQFVGVQRKYHNTLMENLYSVVVNGYQVYLGDAVEQMVSPSPDAITKPEDQEATETTDSGIQETMSEIRDEATITTRETDSTRDSTTVDGVTNIRSGSSSTTILRPETTTRNSIDRDSYARGHNNRNIGV